MWPFSDFQYDFRSFCSTTDILLVVSDRIASAFYWSGPTRAVVLTRFLIRFDMLVIFTNSRLLEFQLGYFLSNRQL